MLCCCCFVPGYESSLVKASLLMFSTTSKNHKNKDLPQLIFEQLNIFLCKNQFNQLFKNETSTITNSYIPWLPNNVPFLWPICGKKTF